MALLTGTAGRGREKARGRSLVGYGRLSLSLSEPLNRLGEEAKARQ